MTFIDVCIGILLVLLAAAVTLDSLARYRNRRDDRLDELTEQEVQEHVYPAGNVVVLERPADETEVEADA